jgi:carboxyl-terminal processing protease
MRKAPLVLLGAAAGVALSVAAMQPWLAFIDAHARPIFAAKPHGSLELFVEAFEQVRTRHVEEPDDRKLIASAIDGMLAGLENSYYVDPELLRRREICTGPGCAGAAGNIGVAFKMNNGLVEILTPIDDTPASRAGIMAGDVITQLDDDPTQGLTYNQVAERLRGRTGTAIRLKIVHSGRDKPVDISIVRDFIATRPVLARPDGGDIGYVRVVEFDDHATDQLKKAIDGIAAQIAPEKLKGYVIDLRNNPGGLLDQAIAVADAFLQDGEIVSIRGRLPEETRQFRATAGDLTNGKPVVVLINAGSASGAEIVAGALQDHKRATVVGTRSFGEGSVATVTPLGPGNGAIHLTTGHYVTPSGHVIAADGIRPDVEVLQDVPDDLKPVAGLNASKPPLQSYVPPDPKADKALNRAYDLLRGTAINAAVRPATATLPN